MVYDYLFQTKKTACGKALERNWGEEHIWYLAGASVVWHTATNKA